jgi:hypothetical protein
MACPSDASIDPVLPSVEATECRDLDFTIAFEFVSFTLSPNLIVLLLLASRVHSLFRRDKVVDWPHGLVLKLASGLSGETRLKR